MARTVHCSSTKVPCLSIHQPWAWAIVAGKKTIENRKWGTTYRGRLVIHTGGSFDSYSSALDHFAAIKLAYQDDCDLYPHKAILGVVDLVDCVEATSPTGLALAKHRRHGKWVSTTPKFSGFYWVLSNARPLRKPILNIGGALGLFKAETLREKMSASDWRELNGVIER